MSIMHYLNVQSSVTFSIVFAKNADVARKIGVRQNILRTIHVVISQIMRRRI